MEEQEAAYPPWLKPLLQASFFSLCEIHESCQQNERNRYCLDCTTDPFCRYCLIHHKNHHVAQIRRSSYHDVIRVEDIQLYLCVPDIQTYIINNAPVVFLNKRPQKGPKKGYRHTCDICQRSITDRFRFCSVGCKLGGIEDGIPELTFNMSINYHANELHGGVEYDESSTETKLGRLHSFKEQATKPLNSPVFGITEAMNSPSPPTLPTYNHFNSRKRKGIPRRASLT